MKTFRIEIVIPLCAALAFAPVAAAKDVGSKTLDAKASASLLSDRTWKQKKHAGPGYNYWSWKADGSLCVRLVDEIGKCSDTGR